MRKFQQSPNNTFIEAIIRQVVKTLQDIVRYLRHQPTFLFGIGTMLVSIIGLVVFGLWPNMPQNLRWFPYALLIFSLILVFIGVIRGSPDGKGRPTVLKGSVLFKDGKPVVGAAVGVEGIESTSLTKHDGNFAIEVPLRDTWEITVSLDDNVLRKTVVKAQVNESVRFVFQLPTFEVGECTPGVSPFQMQCTGEIVRGVQAAKRVVEEIASTDEKQFYVRVTGVERILEYLAAMTDPKGREIENRHKLEMALKDWEQHRKILKTGIKFILWHEGFRRTAYISDSQSAAEAICGLSKHCFELRQLSPSWFLWYGNEQRTVQSFNITEAIVEELTKNPPFVEGRNILRLRNDWAYPIGEFDPEDRHLYVLPPLLTFVAKQEIKGASQLTLDKYLDVSKWRWSIDDPNSFKQWDQPFSGALD